MSDEQIDALAESARNRGLKLVRSRVRTPGKRRFGKVGLADASGKPVFGMDAKGPNAKPEAVEEYLRNLGARDWGASLDVAVLPRTPKRRTAKPDPAESNVLQFRPRPTPQPARREPPPKSKPAPKPKPPPRPEVRDAKPADAPRLLQLIRELGHDLDEKDVRKNLVALKKLGELPFVAAVGKDVIGLCGIHRMRAIHRDKLVGRVNILIVTERAQGQGLGRMLIEEAERRLRKMGCGRIEITVGQARTKAQAFCRHLGYERTTIRFQKLL